MHPFNEHEWRLQCDEAGAFADFCASVAAHFWSAQLRRIGVLNDELIRLGYLPAIDVASLSASLAATVRDRKMREALLPGLNHLPREHQARAQAIAKEYGFITQQEFDQTWLATPRATVEDQPAMQNLACRISGR